MNKKYIFMLFNRLYKVFFPVYRPIYFAYKYWSDRDKIWMIRSYIKPGMKAIDIGANIGFYTILLSKLVGKEGTVYAFEPDVDNFKFLERLTRKLNNVTCANVACGEKSGIAFLYKSEAMNIDHQVYDIGESRERIPVEMVAMDDFLKDEKWSVGFIKIDVQGYDHYVFKGMKEILSRSKEMLIIGELWPYGLKKAGSSAEDYLSEVQLAGFTIEIFSKDNIHDYNLCAEDQYFYVDFSARKKT